MTTEHKILSLVDRGVTRIDDIRGIIGDGEWSEVWSLIKSGMTGRTGQSQLLFLTPKGLDRLNALDEAAA